MESEDNGVIFWNPVFTGQPFVAGIFQTFVDREIGDQKLTRPGLD